MLEVYTHGGMTGFHHDLHNLPLGYIYILHCDIIIPMVGAVVRLLASKSSNEHRFSVTAPDN